MRNCIKGCGTVTDKKHCNTKGCPWLVCVKCLIAFHPDKIHLQIPWKESEK